MRWLLPLLLAACALGPEDGVEVGQRAPPLVATTLSGEAIDTHQARGRPVVLLFWASWSGATRAVAPQLAALHDRYGERVVWVAINTGEDPRVAVRAAGTLGLPGAVVADPDRSVRGRYGVDRVPTVIVLDGEGVVRHRGPGLPSSVQALLDGLVG